LKIKKGDWRSICTGEPRRRVAPTLGREICKGNLQASGTVYDREVGIKLFAGIMVERSSGKGARNGGSLSQLKG